MILLNAKVQCEVDSPCPPVLLLDQKMENFEKTLGELKKLFEQTLKNLPPYVVACAWVMGVVIGVLGTLVVKGGG